MTIDTEKFRFRRFVEEMAKIGDVEVIESPTPLAAVADRLEGNPNGTWFRNVGPDGQELAGNVMGSRSRLAASLGVEERDLLSEKKGSSGAGCKNIIEKVNDQKQKIRD